MESEEESTPSPPPPSEPAPKLPPPLPARPRKAVPQPPSQEETAFDPEAELDDDEISQQMTQSYSEISFKSGLSPENDVFGALTADPMPLADQVRQRPMTLPCERNLPNSKPLVPLNLEGTVHVEGNMTHFVAEDLEHKIRLSSPGAKKGDTPTAQTGSRTCTPSPLYRQLLVPQVGQIDTALINDLECEAHRMATSVDSLIENLCGILHSISSITADNVDVYKNAVTKMSDAMDLNIKSNMKIHVRAAHPNIILTKGRSQSALELPPENAIISMYTMMAKAEEVTQSMKIVEGHAARIKEIKRLVDLFESFV